MSKNKDINSNFQKEDLFGSSSGSCGPKLPNSFDEIFGRLKLVFGVETDTDFARCMGFKQGSVSGAKQKKAIPPAWITEVALSKGVSADWLLTGEGAMMRGEGQGKLDEMAQQPGQMIRQGTSDASLIDPTTQKTNIADLVAKTIEVLQSKTVFQTALESNIEAFHHAIVLERKIDQVEDRIMSKVSARLDALEAENKEIRVENHQLRHELEESRSQSTVRDTG